MMNFMEVIEGIAKGKKYRRKWWAQGFIYEASSPICSTPCLINPEFGVGRLEIQDYQATDWELYEEPKKTYSFEQVVQGLKEGKKFQRKEWDFPEGYIRAEWSSFGGAREHFIINNKRAIPRLSVEDFEATDWVEVK